MRPPEFWSADAQGRDSALMLRALLTPVSLLYGAVAAHKMRSATPARLSIPVVCVGNLTVGGAGKTPIVRALRAKLGEGAHVLARGYGGRARGPQRVTEAADARDVGDEPLLHARDGATWIARDRRAGADAAIAAGAQALILDDGFQNAALAKDLSLVVIDAGSWFGNGQVFPAGPLRERLADGLGRADALILMGESDEIPEALTRFSGPVLRASLAPLAPLAPGPLVAFAGIARPEKFFETLRAGGADMRDALPFPDHHPFSNADLDLLTNFARDREARLITTEKDYVRLPQAWRVNVTVLPVAARFEDEAALDALLAPVAARMRRGA